MSKLVLSGDTSGSVTLDAPAVSGTTILTLPTTTGTLVVTSGAQTIEFADGSASTPSITNSGDTNTGMFFPAADTIAFAEGGTEAMRIDSSGNVFMGITAQRYGTCKLVAETTSNQAAFLGTNYVGDVSSPPVYISKYDNNTTTSQLFVRFLVNNVVLGSGQINANGAAAAAFGSFSDRRLKENIVNLPSQLDNIMALRPVEFDYIESEGGGHQIGFIAQEVKEIYPDLVGEREDGMFTLTDMNKNDARLIKCIQEQQTIINDLKARIETLEAK